MDKERAALLMCVPDFPDGWEFYPIYRHGELAAFICYQGNEIHCFRVESVNGMWLTHQTLERYVQPLIDKYGFVTTRVRDHNKTGQRFVTRLGFVQQFAQDGCIHYKAERLNHARL